jgi:hypothetical protein
MGGFVAYGIGKDCGVEDVKTVHISCEGKVIDRAFATDGRSVDSSGTNNDSNWTRSRSNGIGHCHTLDLKFKGRSRRGSGWTVDF